MRLHLLLLLSSLYSQTSLKMYLVLYLFVLLALTFVISIKLINYKSLRTHIIIILSSSMSPNYRFAHFIAFCFLLTS